MTGEEYKTALRGILEYQVVPLLCERNEGYGSGNLLEDGHQGIAIRMKDKCARIINLVKKEEDDDYPMLDGDLKYSAKIEDAYMDIIGYAINGLLMLQGKLR
jgi:hypothetical protein